MVSCCSRDLDFTPPLDNPVPNSDRLIDILLAVSILGCDAIRGNKRVLVVGSGDYLMVAAMAEVSLTATLIITCNSSVCNGYIRLDELVIRVGCRS